MDIDITKLSRDFKQNPRKKGEIILESDLTYLFLELNLTKKEVAQYLGTQPDVVKKYLREYNLVKDKEQNKLSLENYYMRTLGVKNPALKPGAMDKMKQTMKEKYGVENIAHRAQTTEKRKQTCLEKYGKDNPAKVQQFKDKAIKTTMKKYGVEYASQNKLIQEKQKQTMLKNYGVEYPYQSKEILEKCKQTNIERYGVDNFMKTPEGKEKLQQVMLNRYGVRNPMLCDSIKQKLVNTFIEKYGIDNPLKCPQVFEKFKQTMIDKYGVDNPSKLIEFQQKKYQTMTSNDTWWGKSKPEQEILELLQEIFSDVKTQYNKDPRYPFLCDFYIPELDLFIEYQGFVSHGFHPFNNKDSKDIQKLLDWWTKAYKLSLKNPDKKNAYLTYIKTWTVVDPYKRQLAKDNNLNYLEFFNKEEFMDWYNNYEDLNDRLH